MSKTETFYAPNDPYYSVGIRLSATAYDPFGYIGRGGDSSTPNYGLIRFDTSSIVNRTKIIILAAKFRVYLESNLTATVYLNSYLHRVYKAWNQLANRYGYDGVHYWQDTGGVGDEDRESQHIGRKEFEVSDTIGWHEMNLLSYIPDGIQDMIRGNFTDNGFLFYAADSAYNTKKLFSTPEGGDHPPELVLTYTYGSSVLPVIMD
jgi:hypothetical protein